VKLHFILYSLYKDLLHTACRYCIVTAAPDWEF